MSKSVSDGLARLQNESRIPATTWRQWCKLLEMHPDDAIDVWEEICHPIMVANRKVPEIPYILQLRGARPELDIYEFKDDCAKVLHFITFLFNLEDARLTKGKIKSALLKLYRGVSGRIPSTSRQNDVIERYLADACALVIISKVVKGESITLTGVLKPVVEGKATVAQVARLALKSLGEGPHSRAVREFLHDSFIDPSAPPLDDDEDEDLISDDDDDDVDGLDDDDDDEDEDDDEEDDEDEDDDDDAPIDVALLKFKTALHAIYEFEAGAGNGHGEADEEEGLALGDDLDGDSEEEDDDDEDEALQQRLKVTAAFDPMRAAIPSMEEAQNIARRLEAARNAGRNRPTLSARPSAAPAAGGGGRAGGGGGGGGAGLAGGGGGGGGGVEVIKADAAGGGSGSASTPPPPRKDGGSSARVDTAKTGHVDVDPTDFVDVADVSFPEFSERVQQVCRQLATVEKLDQVVWSLFIDPAASIGDVKALARTLDREDTPTFKAYTAIRASAQLQNIKNLLSIPDKVLQKDRNFMLEVTQLLNTVNNSNRQLQPEARQLAPLAKVLDHAGAALVRLEALRVNTKMGEVHGDQYTRETATVYFEEALRQVTDLTDRDLLQQARDKADSDTVAMIGAYEAAKLVDEVKERCREYVKAMVDADAATSEEALKAYFSSTPLAFDGVEPRADAGDIPVEILKPSELGEVFDTAARYVCGQAWAVMDESHAPGKVVPEIVGTMRELMVSAFQFQPERKRHQDNPRLSLSVVSLDKIAGNQNLKDLFVRVKEDGQVHYVADFEDGTYVDLFELREYKPQRLASAAKKKAAEQETEMLQTGRKYLCTVGRTRKLFGNSPAEVINSCYRGEDGETKVFPAF